MTIRDRIRDFRRVPASQLRPNPKNWRKHPQLQQDALRGVLAEIGYADALLARELPDGTLELIDGHLRAETTPDMPLPVLVLDLSANEADKLLAVLDPLAGLATADLPLFSDLVAGIETDSAAVRSLLDQVTAEAGRLAELESTPSAPTAPPEVEIPEAYPLIVHCQSEADQRTFFERLRNEGYTCRVLTL